MTVQDLRVDDMESNVGLVVVSHNVFGAPGVGAYKARMLKIARRIQSEKPDVVMLQEVYTRGGLKRFRSLLPDLPYATFLPGRIGPKAALLVLSKEPVDEVRFLEFSNRWQEAGKGYRKGALACKIAGVWYVNFHISSNPKALWHEPNPVLEAQARQIDMLVKFINELGDGPMVVGGDSNLARDTKLYQRLETGARLTNPFDDSPTLCGPEGVNWCVDVLAYRGWGEVVSETTLLFAGQTARWTQFRQWPKLKGGVVSDHNGLKLQLKRRALAKAA
jgi:endonuclease/exonuclease/phosphatase family metal-dependent hydrolase